MTGHVAAERELEQKLQRLPSSESAERTLRILTSTPHMAGTDGSRRVAEFIRDQLRSYGFEAELVRYRAWLPQPTEVKLELVQPETKALGTPEEPFESDKDTYDKRAVVGFNSYSPSGEVTAPVVYVNYGTQEDYRRLSELSVGVEGKIVLARYGRGFRGVKAKVAEENKAAGLILYSDPADDGYVAGDAYPRGPWRPMSGIQRGSIQYTFIFPGDPLTPGVAATEQAQRIDPRWAQNLPHIPTMPVSPRDALEILQHLDGPQVPREWQGGLPLTYHTGPGQAVLHLKLVMDYQQRAIYDVVGKLRGQHDDEWVVVGNHHDAWVFGAVDPSSGTTAVLEAARALGELARAGWKPRRTILIGHWDAEEYGLIGSTEWVEEHAAELQRKAVAYINLDSAVSGGNFGGSATPSLRELVREAAREVADPRTGRSVYEVWKERLEKGQGPRSPSALAPPIDAPRQNDSDPPLGMLGAGSDFTPFFHHVGIPSLDMGFGGDYGVYHALYDDFYWMKTFGDPSFVYHAAMARMVGILVLRLAESDLLPFDYDAYATEIDRYRNELEVLAKVSPEGKLDFSALRDAAAALKTSAARAQKALEAHGGVPMDATRATALNRQLVDVEQALLAPQGLTGRPWFRHTIYAPGTYTGYSAVLLPGVREALDRKDWDTARRETSSLVEALHRAAARLDEIARVASSNAKVEKPAAGR
ncbi:MAG: M28 family metallopeptidase [Acidobacteria bacterium]|nr:M28 family metallopeptidase [Acidobacteriota bacterium]